MDACQFWPFIALSDSSTCDLPASEWQPLRDFQLVDTLEGHLEISDTVALVVALDLTKASHVLGIVPPEVTVFTTEILRQLNGIRREHVDDFDLITRKATLVVIIKTLDRLVQILALSGHLGLTHGQTILVLKY